MRSPRREIAASCQSDASVHATSTLDVGALISANLDPCLAGCTVAVRRFLAAGYGGSIEP